MSTGERDTGTGGGEDGILAAEYVLHLLPPDERARAESRLDVDGGFRRVVVGWTEYFSGIALEVAPVVPPPGLRAALERRIARDAGASAPRRARRGGVGGALGWLLGGLAAAAATLVILAVALPRIEPPYSGPFYEATLDREETDFLAVARFDPRDGTMVIELRSGAAPPGRELELWLLPDGASSPTSLGLLPEEPVARVTLPPDVAEGVPGGLLEISEEPPGGSPTGGPTGNVLGVGEVGAV